MKRWISVIPLLLIMTSLVISQTSVMKDLIILSLVIIIPLCFLAHGVLCSLYSRDSILYFIIPIISLMIVTYVLVNILAEVYLVFYIPSYLIGLLVPKVLNKFKSEV